LLQQDSDIRSGTLKTSTNFSPGFFGFLIMKQLNFVFCCFSFTPICPASCCFQAPSSRRAAYNAQLEQQKQQQQQQQRQQQNERVSLVQQMLEDALMATASKDKSGGGQVCM